MHERERFATWKTLGKNLFHSQSDWSGSGPAGQFWQLGSALRYNNLDYNDNNSVAQKRFLLWTNCLMVTLRLGAFCKTEMRFKKNEVHIPLCSPCFLHATELYPTNVLYRVKHTFFMRNSCRGFWEIYEKHISPPTIYILQILCNINQFETNQLNLRRLELSATMLKIVKYITTLNVAKNISKRTYVP